MGQVFEKVYCAFCKLERGVCRKKHVSWTNVVLAALCSLLIMYVVWGGAEPKAVIVFAIALMFAEVFVHLRWRMTMPCPHCHFDPVLYKRDPEMASKHVKAHLDVLKASGGHLLKTNNPFQHIARITRDELNAGKNDADRTSAAQKEIAQFKQKTERILSRHI